MEIMNYAQVYIPQNIKIFIEFWDTAWFVANLNKCLWSKNSNQKVFWKLKIDKLQQEMFLYDIIKYCIMTIRNEWIYQWKIFLLTRSVTKIFSLYVP